MLASSTIPCSTCITTCTSVCLDVFSLNKPPKQTVCVWVAIHCSKWSLWGCSLAGNALLHLLLKASSKGPDKWETDIVLPLGSLFHSVAPGPHFQVFTLGEDYTRSVAEVQACPLPCITHYLFCGADSYVTSYEADWFLADSNLAHLLVSQVFKNSNVS